MTIERIKQLHAAKPFRPFSLHLTDGRQIPVFRSDWMEQAPSGEMVVVAQADDHLDFIGLKLIKTIQMLPSWISE
jgi:hypothetical protein